MPGLPDGGGAALAEEPPAAVLSEVFGDRVTLARTYAAHLATTGVTYGLLGPREVPRLWGRHLLNCAVVAPLLPPAARVVDVGSGAGLPGLVLALVRPDAQVTLVEPLLRRVTWLAEVVGELGLGNVQVVRARADEVERGEADVATARAVAPLDKLSAWCLPLLRPGGRLLAIKGRSAHEELLAAEPGLRAAGAERWGVHVLEGDYLDEPTTVVEVKTAARRPSVGAPGRSRSRGQR